RHFPDRRAGRRLDPVVGHAIATRRFLHLGIVGIEEDGQLRRVEILLVLDAGGFGNPVGIVENDAEIADAPDTGFRAHGWLAGLDAREAEDALLRLSARPVVIDLLVGAAGDAHAPAATALLIDQDNAVFSPLVDRARRTGSEARRVEAMLAQARQVHEERVFELPVDFLFDALEIVVLAAFGELAAEVVFPVAAPLDLLHDLAGHQRARLGGRLRLQLWRLGQPVVFEREGLVEVVNLWKVGVGKELGQHAPLGADARLKPSILLANPAAFPALLVLPVFGIADAWLGLDVVEPDVFNPFPVGPDVLAGDRAGVTPDAFVEVEHHGNLGADLHERATSALVSAVLSNQLRFVILRTMMNSSRLAPTVP